MAASFFMASSLLHAFGILCFAFAWVAYDHYRPWVNFHSETLAIYGVGLLLASEYLKKRGLVAPAPRVVLWILALALLPWVQYVAGISLFAGDAVVASLFLCSLGAAIWLGYTYAVAGLFSEKALTPIFYSLWVIALLSAVIGLLQWLELTEPFTMYMVQADSGDSGRAMGNLGQPNQLATLLLMGMACWIWTFEQKRIGRFPFFLGVAVLTMGLVLSQSRAGIVSALVMSIFLMWKNWHDASKLAPRYIFLWLLAFGVAVQLLPTLNDLMLMGSSRGGVRFSDGARSIMWKQMLAGIGQAPWVGYGWNQTPTAHSAGSIAVPGSLTFSYGHNIVLDIVAWNGVPVGLLLTGVCVWWFLSRIKAAKGSDAVSAMACLLPIAVHSLVEFPFAYAYFLIAAGLMVGIVEGGYFPSVKPIMFNTRWAGAGLAMWLVLGTYMVYEYVLIEEDFRVVRFENLRLGKTPVDYEVPDVWMLSHMASMLKAARQQALPGMDEQGIENLRKASLRFPYGALSVRYALAMGLNGDPEGATRQMAIIRGMYGNFYYQAAVNVLRDQQEKYPELSKVLTP